MCEALYSLSIEQCCITSRTIQRIADVLQEGHALSQLKIGMYRFISRWFNLIMVLKFMFFNSLFAGKNSPLSGNSMVNLLGKLTKLTRLVLKERKI